MTCEQIDKHLAALRDYEFSLHRNTWDDPDRVSDELLKILTTRERLQRMRREIIDA